MHIPDGIIPLPQAIVYFLIAGIALGYSLLRARTVMDDRHIPLLGVLAAGLFAAQMFNFPVPYGSSGHLVGTALATAFVGPCGAIIVIASVLLVQAAFGDGGITAYGANLLNMGVIAALTSYFVIESVKRFMPEDNPNTLPVAVGIAGFLSTVVAATAASAELVLAGLEPAALVFGWMILLHTIIGSGEALISAAIVKYTVSMRRDLLELPKIGIGKVSTG